MSATEKPSKIRIVFQSGYVADFEASEFTVQYRAEKIIKVSWKGTTPTIMHIDVTQIESVWEL